MDIKIEPDPPPRDGPWHRKIVAFNLIEGTRSGNWLRLECGHVVQSFGDLSRAEGRVLCTQCRDAADSLAQGRGLAPAAERRKGLPLTLRLTIRGYVRGVCRLTERHDVDGGDEMADLATRHARTLLACPGGEKHMVEIEFLDEPDPLRRYFRFGTDSGGMVNPLRVTQDLWREQLPD